LFSGGFLGFQELLSVSGHLHLGDDEVAGVQTDVDGLAVSLFSGDSFDVNDVLLSVDGDDFAGLFAFEVASNDLDFIVFNEWHGSDVVLSSEFFAQTGAHDLSSEMTWGVEMSFSALSGTAGDGGVLFGHFSLQLNF
jgi:hypothetical protein